MAFFGGEERRLRITDLWAIAASLAFDLGHEVGAGKLTLRLSLA